MDKRAESPQCQIHGDSGCRLETGLFRFDHGGGSCWCVSSTHAASLPQRTLTGWRKIRGIAVEQSSSLFGDVRSGHIETHLNTVEHIWTHVHIWCHICLGWVSEAIFFDPALSVWPAEAASALASWCNSEAGVSSEFGKKITGSWKRSPEIVHSCHNVHSIALRLALEMFIRFILTLSPTFAPWSPLGWASQTMAGRAAIAASCCARRLSWICWSRALPYDLGAAETRLSLSQKSEQKMM